MNITETRPGAGTLHGYLPQKDATKFAELPIGTKRLLTVMEEGDMLAAGLTREQIADMTPESLKNLADISVELSPNSVAC